VVSYFSESKDRIKQKHYQNSMRTACRWWALTSAARSSKVLISAEQTCSERTFVRLTCEVGDFNGAQMQYVDLTSANFRDANLRSADLRNATLQDADLTGANLGEADLEGANLAKADLRNSDFRNTKWQKIEAIKLANVFGIKNAPAGFLNWAI